MIVIVVKAQEGRIIKTSLLESLMKWILNSYKAAELRHEQEVASLVTYLKDVTEGSSRTLR